MVRKTLPNWSVAIFAGRESAATLGRCIGAAVAACAGHCAAIDVLVTGNPALAAAVAQGSWDGDASVRIWSVAIGDKSHAWNEYLHRIWHEGRPAFFIDGYTELRGPELNGLHMRLERPRTPPGRAGRRSGPLLREQMLVTGGLHGNLHIMDASDMAALRAAGFRLPLGLYRSDSLIGAALMFGLDPANNTWERRRAGRTLEKPSQAIRVLGQPPGDSQDGAVRGHGSSGPAPVRTSRQLVHDWLVEHPRQTRTAFFKRPLCLQAARKLKTEDDWSLIWAAPELVTPPGLPLSAAAAA